MLKNDLGINPPKLENAPLESNSFIRWMWFFVKDKKWMFLATSFTRLMSSVIELAHIYIAGQIVNSLISGGELYGFPAPLFWLAMFCVMYGLYVVLILDIRFIGEIRSYTEKRFSITCLRQYFKLSMVFHENMATGGQLQKLLQARSAIQNLFFTYYFNILSFSGNMVGLVMLLYVTPLESKYYFLFAGYIFCYAAFVSYFVNHMAVLIKDATIKKETVVAKVYEFLNHIRLVKTHVLHKKYAHAAVEFEFDHHQSQVHISKHRSWFWIGNSLIAVFFSVIILYNAISDSLSGAILVGTFVILSQLTWSLWSYLEQIVWILSDSSEQKISVMRAVDILKEKQELIDLLPAQKAPTRFDSIQFDNISFHYSGHEENKALSNISMNIPRGQHIGLVGYSGSGKSTFVKLLMKLALPTEGKIKLDDADLAYIPRDVYLEKVSFVPQDVDLFNDTIRENILVGKEVSEERLEEVLNLSHVSEFIKTLPKGLESVVGERGVKLSGGQRQRLGIARAIARDGDIIIFDEATSALDSVSENYIQQALESSFTGKTMVVIAHRLATIAHLDRIYVFDKGHIVEQGTHEELLALDGRYTHMWNLQSDGFLKDDEE